jgi:hypothetical protein
MGADVTELEQARAHLLNMQGMLRNARLRHAPLPWVDRRENAVLAALSWVWEAQQRMLREEENDLIGALRKLHPGVVSRVIAAHREFYRLRYMCDPSDFPRSESSEDFPHGISREEARGALKRFDAEAFPRHAFA